MKKLTILFSIVALAATFNTNAADTQKERRAVRERADRQDTKTDVEDRIRTINRLDNKPATRDAGLRAVSKELGIPVPTLEAQLKSHPNIGIAGLLVANSIAQESKKDAESVIKAHSTDRSWQEVARNNSVTLGSLDTKLGNVESAMKEGK